MELFLNSIEPEDDSEEFLGALDYSRDQDSYEINLREIIDNIVIGGNIPIGCGLSSSTAYIISLIHSIIKLYNLKKNQLYNLFL